MRRSEAFPSKYIGKDDLKSPLLVTIKEVSTAMIKGDHGDECKTVMFFSELDAKPLIINSVNWMAIEDAYGEESDDWHGKTVELYVDPNVMYGGKRTGGVRVRVPITRQAVDEVPLGQGATMTFAEALTACEAVGITKGQLVESLKEQGHSGYKSSRDTAHVLHIIQNVKARLPVESVTDPTEDEDIPF